MAVLPPDRQRLGAFWACVVWAASLSAGLAHAQTTCADLSALIGAIPVAATAGQPRPKGADFGLPAANHCATSRSTTGAAEPYCAWKFDYRDAEATSAFYSLSVRLRSCAATVLSAGGDAAVNHPDSYVLQQYETDQGTVSLSIKDKAGLHSTYVFLRLSN